ncbi:hypothetical protein VNO77_16118 [Canavalia gladiata]|uniref:Uncharacterized protein n=1 Tax=Canavalia gladiata TaxID=3824 RepID=A0AAN9QRR2_CANGL
MGVSVQERIESGNGVAINVVKRLPCCKRCRSNHWKAINGQPRHYTKILKTTSSRWNNVGKRSQQNGSVISGKGLPLRARHGSLSPEPVGCRWIARAAPAARADRCL